MNSTVAGTITVAANAFTDAAGNGNTAFSLPTPIAIDTLAPTIVIASSTSALKIGDTATITFTLSEPSVTFSLATLTAAGGSLSSFAGTGASYSAIFTPNANSTTPGSITVANNTFFDAAGNGNIAGALAPTIAIDTIAPTVTIASSKADLKIGDTAIITFTLSELSANFTESDVVVSGGTLSGFAGAGTAYTATFTPTIGSMAAGSIFVPASSFFDTAGNGNVAGALAMPLSIDTVAPTVTVTPSKASLKTGETATILFTLSETSTNFTSSDVTVTGGTLSGFAGSGTNYSVTFTPTAHSNAPGVISIPANSFTDAAGNGNGTIEFSITVDTAAPSVMITSNKNSLKSGETATITFTLSELATNFTAADVAVSGGTLSTLSGSGSSYSATFTPTANATTAGSVSVAAGTFTDAAGNSNTAGVLSPSLTIDTIAPTVSITSNASTVRVGQTATVSFTLSEVSTTFTAASVTTTGGTLSEFTGSGTSYTATFTPAANATTPGNVSVASGGFTDAAGNANTAASLATSIAIDTLAPTVVSFTSTTANGTYGIGNVIALAATLSEPVQAGGAITVVLNTGAIVTLRAVTQGTTLTGSYNVTPGEVAYPLDVVSYQLSANTILDAAGNAMTSSALPDAAGRLATLKNLVIDASISVSSGAGFSMNPGVIADRRANVTAVPIIFSTPVKGVSLAAIRLSYNGRSVSLRGASITGSGTNYVLRLPARSTSLRGLYTVQVLPTTGIRAVSNGAAMMQTAQIYWGYGRSVGIVTVAKKR